MTTANMPNILETMDTLCESLDRMTHTLDAHAKKRAAEEKWEFLWRVILVTLLLVLVSPLLSA